MKNELSLDYLAINVTVSPFRAVWLDLVNSTGEVVAKGENFTRADAFNATARWNASDVSVIDGFAVLNDSNSQVVQEFNVSLVDGFPGFSGNWTNYTLNLTNTSQFRVAGNYTVRFRAYDSFYQQNTSAMVSWFTLWGYADVAGIVTNRTDNRVLGGKDVLLCCNVVDSNSSYPARGYNVSFYNGTVYIGSSLTNGTGWADQAYVESDVGEANYSISCNISDYSDAFYYASPDDSGSLMLQVINDPYPPVVNSVQFRQQGLATDASNLYTNLTIVSDITDNVTMVMNASANVTYPDGTSVVVMLAKQSGNEWRFVFNVSDSGGAALNQTGNYTVNVTAYDEAGNLDCMGDRNFTVYDSYTVNLTHHVADVAYNRGENLTLYAMDVNGFVVSGVNWTFVNVTRYGMNETNLTNGSGFVNTTFAYNVRMDDPVGDWVLKANVTKDSNAGSGTIGFNVSNLLGPYFTSPTDGSVVTVSQALTIWVKVNHSRGSEVPYDVEVNMTCQNPAATYTLAKSAGVYQLNGSDACSAVGQYSTQFSLTATVTDGYNNTGTGQISLTTGAQPSSPPGSSPPSSPSPGLAACECGDWGGEECGVGLCASGELYQTRSCNPAGCKSESRCVDHPGCTEMDFEFFLLDEQVTIMQGGERTVMMNVSNTGKVVISINLTGASECGSLTLNATGLDLNVNDEKDTSFDLHVPAYQEIGDCGVNVTVMATGGGNVGALTKTRSLAVLIEEHTMMKSLRDLEQDLLEIGDYITSLSDSGVDVTGLQEIRQDANNLLQTARSSIQDDDLDGLSRNVMEAADLLDSIDESRAWLQAYKALLDFKWIILAIAVLIVIAAYLTTQVLMPFGRIRRELIFTRERESDLVQARVNTEKEYFKRHIDEPTFKKLLADNQGEIAELKAQATDKERDLEFFFRKRLSPSAVAAWLASPVTRFRRRGLAKDQEKGKEKAGDKK